jgi:hypothetical protein
MTDAEITDLIDEFNEIDGFDFFGFARALESRVLAERKPSIGAHLWMPVEIAEPTKAPQDFGDRKSYAFKAPDAGEHDPWYVVLPNMHAMKLGYHADDATDRQHAEFIAAAINRALAHPAPDDAARCPHAAIGAALIASGLYDRMRDITGGDREARKLIEELIATVDPVLDRWHSAAIDRARQSGEEGKC